MAVPTSLSDLNVVIASNSPAGNESVGSPGKVDDYFRAHAGLIAQVNAAKAPLASPTFTGHITTEGVTATGATGTGKFVFDNSPTFTGTVSAAAIAAAGLISTTNGTWPGVTAALTAQGFDRMTWVKSTGGSDAKAWDMIADGATIAVRAVNDANSVATEFIKCTRSGTTATSTEIAGNVLVGYSSSNGSYKLQVNSQIFATNATIATSDERYKENISPLRGSLELLNELRPVTFTWKEQQDVKTTADIDGERKSVVKREKHNFNDGVHVGLIAQEVKAALQEVVWKDSIVKKNGRPAVVDADGNEVAPKEEFLGLSYTELIPLIIDAIQELSKKVNKLEAP